MRGKMPAINTTTNNNANEHNRYDDADKRKMQDLVHNTFHESLLRGD